MGMKFSNNQTVKKEKREKRKALPYCFSWLVIGYFLKMTCCSHSIFLKTNKKKN